MLAPDCTASAFTFTYRLEASPDRYDPRVVAVLHTDVGVNVAVDLGARWGVVELRSYCCGAAYGWPMDNHIFCSNCGNSLSTADRRPESVGDPFEPEVDKVYATWFDLSGLIASPLLADQLRELVCNLHASYGHLEDERRACATEEDILHYLLQRLGGHPMEQVLELGDPRLRSHRLRSDFLLEFLWDSFAFAVEFGAGGTVTMRPLSFCCTATVEPSPTGGSSATCGSCGVEQLFPLGSLGPAMPKPEEVERFAAIQRPLGVAEEAESVVELLGALQVSFPEGFAGKEKDLASFLWSWESPL